MKDNRLITIDFITVVRILLADKKKICIYSIVAGVIGLIFAFGTPKTYKSTVILAPEESGAGFSGSISSLASMVGMNMKIGQTGDALYPEIYPDLVQSTDFIVGLFDIIVTKDKSGESMPYYDYLEKHQKIALADYPKTMILNLVRKLKTPEAKRGEGEKPDPFHLTKIEYEIYKLITSNITCSVDKKTDVITITVKDQDPLIAATLADSVQQHLQKAITDYRTKKARIDMEYMQTLFDEAKQDYDDARHRYAVAADANINVMRQTYKQHVDDLESDLEMKKEIYSTVVEQLQIAKAKVQERTPAFTIIQRASVPIKHSNIPKLVTLIIWMFFGFIMRCTMLALKNKEKFINL